MRSPELAPLATGPVPEMDFGMEGFDINEMFHEALSGVATDEELALDEKVLRMEVIVSEGTSEVYRDFVDFRQLASQMEMICTHDHALGQSIQDSDTLGGFMGAFADDDGHGHAHEHDEDGATKSTKKKTKKKKPQSRSWLRSLLDA